LTVNSCAATIAFMKRLIQIQLEQTLHEQLEKLAQIDHRSKTAEALSILERAVADRMTELQKGAANADEAV